MTSEIVVISGCFIVLFRLFDVTVKINNYRRKIESFGNVITCYISASPKWKLRNNIDVTDYFAGDNEMCQ